MGWQNDIHGIVLKKSDISEIKIYQPSHTWNMKLSQLGKQKAKLIILSYSTNDDEYNAAQKIFNKRPRDILFICHEKFKNYAENLSQQYPCLYICTHNEIHTKLVAYPPKTVYIGSGNFLDSSWHDCNVGIRSRKGYDWCINEIVKPILFSAEPTGNYQLKEVIEWLEETEK